MFDVLVYLYENYWRPDACPDHDQPTRKLSSVGFESDEIQEALTWLDGLAQGAQAAAHAQSARGMRVYTDAERELLGEPSIGFISFLESSGVLVPSMREMVLDLRKQGSTVIFSTHDMSVAEKMCDFIFMIYRGQKVLDGSLRQIQTEHGRDVIHVRLESNGHQPPHATSPQANAAPGIRNPWRRRWERTCSNRLRDLR